MVVRGLMRRGIVSAVAVGALHCSAIVLRRLFLGRLARFRPALA
jgi:hypothetical protein